MSDTINRGTGDPAIVQATLPDPKNPKWSGEFNPPNGGAVGTPTGPKVANSARAGSASPTDLSGPASNPASALPAAAASPLPTGAEELLTRAGMPPAGADSQEAQLLAAPPVQTVPAQPPMADIQISQSPGEAPGSAAAFGSPAPVQALPPVEESRPGPLPGAVPDLTQWLRPQVHSLRRRLPTRPCWLRLRVLRLGCPHRLPCSGSPGSTLSPARRAISFWDPIPT